MNNKITIIPMTMLLLALSSFQSVYAQSDVQQLNQKINFLENRIQQLQTQINNQSVPSYSPWAGSDYQWDPFLSMQNMQQQMNYVMNELPNNVAKVDMQETPDRYVITMSMPGIDKSKISVELRDRTLVISGKGSQELTQHSNQYTNKENSYGYFMQSIVLPRNAMLDEIHAQYNNGILTVDVPLNKGHEKKNVNFKKIAVE